MHRDGERGQVLVLGALMMTVMLAFLALIVDVGYAYAQRRFVQNGSDAAAFAATRLLATRLNTTTPDALIAGEVAQYAAANGQGTVPLAASLTADRGAWYVTPSNTRIAAVGSGVTIPAAPIGGFPQLAGQPVAGVEVAAGKQFDTFFAGVLGYQTMTVHAGGTARLGQASSVLLDSTETGQTVGPLAFDEAALQSPNLANCGGYGANVQVDQFIDIPTTCVTDTTIHFSFTTLNVGSNCSQNTVNTTIDRLIDDPTSFGSQTLVAGQTDIQVCSGVRMSGLDRFISLGRPIIVPIVRHDQAATCSSNCVARVTGFAYLRLTALYGNGSNSYAEGRWIDPRTMPPLKMSAVTTTSTSLFGPAAMTLVR